MPLALEQLDLRGYDLVISSESGPAKGVITDPDTVHLCYCHSPMRYLWDFYHAYLDGRSPLVKAMMKASFHYLRIWDEASAARVDTFIANSAFTASRIEKYWRRDSIIVHPPVDIERFEATGKSEGYYLWLGQLVDYKRPDIAIQAFSESGRRLIVAGRGPELKRLKRISSPNIEFVESPDDATVKRLLEHCEALVFPGTEDFGIVLVEAMACGKPVIAYRRGGAAEAVVDHITGMLFDTQSPSGLNATIKEFEADRAWVDCQLIRKHAERFSEQAFQKRFLEVVDTSLHTRSLCEKRC